MRPGPCPRTRAGGAVSTPPAQNMTDTMTDQSEQASPSPDRAGTPEAAPDDVARNLDGCVRIDGRDCVARGEPCPAPGWCPATGEAFARLHVDPQEAK